MAFINIFSGEPLSKDLLVVGYLDKDKRELATSTNRVVRVTKKGYPERFKGYSKDLSANVILTTFSKRNVCIRIAIPGSVKEDIYWDSCVSEEDILERVRLVQNIFAEKFN